MSSATDQLAVAFTSCQLPQENWTHEAHLRVGLWHLLRYDLADATMRLRDGIKRYNVACGVQNTETQGYHETITLFYIRMIHYFLREVDKLRPIDELADELIRRYGDRNLPLHYYRRETLMSLTARRDWVEPDLRPLPG